MAEQRDTWTVTNISQELKKYFASFNFEIPKDTTNLSFAMGLLEKTMLDEFVSDMKSLSRGVLFHRTIVNRDIKPGAVYVLEVNAKLEGQHIKIHEKVMRKYSKCFCFKCFLR